MGRKILVTESQLRFIIENVDYISEQKKLQSPIKIKRGKGKTINILKGKPSQRDKVSFDNYQVKTPEDQWSEYLNNDSEITSVMSSRSKGKWKKLKSDQDNIGYAVAVLERFNETNPTTKWESVVVNSETEIINIVQQPEESVEDSYPGIPVKFPKNLNPHAPFFKDNSFTPTELFKKSVKEDIIDPLIKINQEYGVGDDSPKFWLESMNILTSCSTLPNGKSPEDGKKRSFKELSEARNKAAYEYIVSQLKGIGVLIDGDSKVLRNSDGKNGDGTSGPKWTGKNEDRHKYEKYKYLDVELKVAMNIEKPIQTTLPDEPEDKIESIETPTYNVLFRKPAKGKLRITLPKIKLQKMFAGRRKPSRKNWGSVKCTKFK
jgi:hypothetical protein